VLSVVEETVEEGGSRGESGGSVSLGLSPDEEEEFAQTDSESEGMFVE
jgi:hypothetical protein